MSVSHCLIPVECTDYQSKELWNRINENFSEYYPKRTKEMHQRYMKLKTAGSIDELINTILEILNMWEENDI